MSNADLSVISTAASFIESFRSGADVAAELRAKQRALSNLIEAAKAVVDRNWTYAGGAERRDLWALRDALKGIGVGGPGV